VDIFGWLVDVLVQLVDIAGWCLHTVWELKDFM